MRGEAKICLFDAKSGKKVYEQTEHNMVTNAASRILSPRNEWIYGNTNNLIGNFSSAVPFYSRLFGGVLLFDNTITENANTVLPPSSVNNVGYAGSAYSGTNTLRGSYNANESQAITNGYRHVWDFGTDKANGTIRSVCLTSLLGGNSGWKLPAGGDSSVSSLSEPGSFTSADNVIFLKRGVWKPIFQKAVGATGNIETICVTPSGEIVLLTDLNMNQLKLTSEFSSMKATPTSTIIGQMPMPHANTGVLQSTHYYDGKIHRVYSSVNSTASFSLVHEVYGLDGALETTTNITTATAFNGSVSFKCFYKGKYIVTTNSTGTSLSIFEADGTLSGEITNENLPSVSSTWFRALVPCYDQVTDTMFLTTNNDISSSAPKYVYYLNSSLTVSAINSTRNTGAFAIVTTADDIRPYVLTSNMGSQNTAMYLGLFNPYLGTINNLASAVTKTSAHTMKIVYSIYDD